MKQLALAGLSLLASMTASAAVLESTSFFLVYAETTALRNPTITLGPADEVNISWSLGTALNYLNIGPSPSEAAPDPVPVLLPTYQMIAKSGFQMSGPITGFADDVIYADVFGDSTFIYLVGAMDIDGNVGVVNATFDKTPLVAIPGTLEVGTFSFSPTLPVGDFSSFAFGGMLLLRLSGTQLGAPPANGVSLTAIQSRAENTFQVSFFASPVPVPPAVSLFSSALVGTVLRQRAAA